MTPRDELIEEISSKHHDIYVEGGMNRPNLKYCIAQAIREFAARTQRERKGERRKSLAEWQQFIAFKLSERDNALSPQKAVFLYRSGTDRRRQDASSVRELEARLSERKGV